ncbi:MAG: MBL fold metallo-hydrolase [Firmicutes bacterium]|nr:MBL fold metallo-hydrolase [Bacillota bacterium]
MNVKKVVVGLLETNCYILEKGKECLIIDPGDEPHKIEQQINKTVKAIIVTHNHFDHVGGVSYFKEKYGVEVYDYDNLKEGINNISEFMFEVLYMPGHTVDSIVIYFKEEQIMFVGDFIFYHTIGRTDLEGGNFVDMKKSISRLKEYRDITLYPGHGCKTTLEEERINNSYFR